MYLTKSNFNHYMIADSYKLRDAVSSGKRYAAQYGTGFYVTNTDTNRVVFRGNALKFERSIKLERGNHETI